MLSDRGQKKPTKGQEKQCCEKNPICFSSARKKSFLLHLNGRSFANESSVSSLFIAHAINKLTMMQLRKTAKLIKSKMLERKIL